METISYFVVWIGDNNKEKYTFLDITVDKMDYASEIEEKISDKLSNMYGLLYLEIKHVSFLKSNKTN